MELIDETQNEIENSPSVANRQKRKGSTKAPPAKKRKVSPSKYNYKQV